MAAPLESEIHLTNPTFTHCRRCIIALNENRKCLQAAKEYLQTRAVSICLEVITAYFLRSGTRQK